MMRIFTIFCCNLKWTDSHGKAFIESKKLIAQGPVLRHFSPQFPIIPQVDVCSVGVGGGFLQNDQSVVFDSNILRATKQCSAVTENESVAKYLDFKNWNSLLYGNSDINTKGPIATRKYLQETSHS